MKIYTKTGDLGETSLLGGKRVKKSNPRIDAYGTVDELNSYIGLLISLDINEDRKKLLAQIQNNLFVIGSHLACAPDKKIEDLPLLENNTIIELENQIDEMTKVLPEMKNFILPGGNQQISFCHITRCVCRRAERCVVELNENEKVEPILIQYLNRLSDYLFILARKIGQETNTLETPWKSK
jgi:cob(I)alamin adenosyltransferase